MDNQKSTEGKGISATNAGSSIGQSQDSSLNKNTTSSGNLQSGSPSTGTGALGTSSVGSGSLNTSTGNSGLGNSGSSASTGAGSTSGSIDSGTSTVGGIKAAIASITPEKVHEGIDKAGQAAQPVVDSLVSKAHAGVDKVTGLIGTAQEKFGDRSTQLTEKYSDLSAQGKEYVKNNPGSALLAAVGVGFILAKLLGGSSDRNDYRNYRD